MRIGHTWQGVSKVRLPATRSSVRITTKSVHAGVSVGVAGWRRGPPRAAGRTSAALAAHRRWRPIPASRFSERFSRRIRE